ncbi:hypothetical protein GGS23DRAFT_540129 [Durotheca rogersii]|uniref:uncharacterized protein n=1 Tax=Durotheca rogersii TaxID=419775 RepID=UPI00221EF018|nr:uncharacterized protein GGS23DRAFT_540129 [Durotheca rogersii]KAI5863568.1 hypothetical protein GGS23DRAFT_540129 [Durotheca rogersii]
MSGKRVKFQISASGSPKGRRSHEQEYDSGIGSSSSDQTSMGGRTDRRFTKEDCNDQLYSVGSLQEALGQANIEVEHLQRERTELDKELSKSHKLTRDAERRYHEAYERCKNLEQHNKELSEDNATQAEQIKELKTTCDRLERDCQHYRSKYIELLESRANAEIRGGSGEPSKDVKERKDRSKRHSGSREDNPDSSGRHRRSSSVSVGSGVRSTSKKPYIEKMPDSPGNYVASSTDSRMASHLEPPPCSRIPRTTQPDSPSIYQPVVEIPTGDYVRYPLHDNRERQGGRRRS